ncbi:MAG TPA: hypothetical protein VFM25_11435 [Verrucomicrobiae bacterium]|nr:hypothetical protein [Verrucomicrobiae bacterium]
MALFRKKADPISDRARALNAEIAALEAKIKKLGGQVQENPASAPRLRSTAAPQGNNSPAPENSAPPPPAPAHEPIFEPVDQNRLKARGETVSTPEHYNELGVRKYDLPALLRRLRNQFSGPSTTNPKLVNYLAAGGIQGLRPMRYEKRVARNRFIALVIVLFFTLLGIIVVFLKH